MRYAAYLKIYSFLFQLFKYSWISLVFMTQAPFLRMYMNNSCLLDGGSKHFILFHGMIFSLSY